MENTRLYRNLRARLGDSSDWAEIEAQLLLEWNRNNQRWRVPDAGNIDDALAWRGTVAGIGYWHDLHIRYLRAVGGHDASPPIKKEKKYAAIFD